MFFIEERIRKILQELKGQIYKDTTNIEGFKCKDGSDSSIEAAKAFPEPRRDFGAEEYAAKADIRWPGEAVFHGTSCQVSTRD